MRLPLALLLGVVAVQIVVLCLSATDAMCSAVAGGASSSVSSLLSTLSAGLVSAVSDYRPGQLRAAAGRTAGGAAAFVLWLELLVRAAAVYVAALFLPMALVTLVWPSVSHWCRRLVETLAALILSKFVIVATLSLAAGAVASGVNGSGGPGSSSFASVLAGGARLVLATFVPFAILRLIPMVEAGAMAHLEGAPAAAAALTRVPRSAAAAASLNTGLESLGAARLAAVAGGVGTGGGGGAAAASRAGSTPSSDELLPSDTDENGVVSRLPDGGGVAVGVIPGSLEAEAGVAQVSGAPARRPGTAARARLVHRTDGDTGSGRDGGGRRSRRGRNCPPTGTAGSTACPSSQRAPARPWGTTGGARSSRRGPRRTGRHRAAPGASPDGA